MGFLGAAFGVANAISKSKVWKTAVSGAMKGMGIAKKVAATPAVRAGAGMVGGAAAWEGGKLAAGRAFGQQPALTPISGLPALSGFGGGQMPAAQSYAAPGQMISQVPEVLEMNHPLIRAYYRAPKGFVIVRQNGQYVGAVRKDVARRAKLWKPARKPPITARDWHCYQTAEKVEKKLRKIAGKAVRATQHRVTCKKK
jgi:hypothetical protein